MNRVSEVTLEDSELPNKPIQPPAPRYQKTRQDILYLVGIIVVTRSMLLLLFALPLLQYFLILLRSPFSSFSEFAFRLVFMSFCDITPNFVLVNMTAHQSRKTSTIIVSLGKRIDKQLDRTTTIRLTYYLGRMVLSLLSRAEIFESNRLV